MPCHTPPLGGHDHELKRAAPSNYKSHRHGKLGSPATHFVCMGSCLAFYRHCSKELMIINCDNNYYH